MEKSVNVGPLSQLQGTFDTLFFLIALSKWIHFCRMKPIRLRCIGIDLFIQTRSVSKIIIYISDFCTPFSPFFFLNPSYCVFRFKKLFRRSYIISQTGFIIFTTNTVFVYAFAASKKFPFFFFFLPPAFARISRECFRDIFFGAFMLGRRYNKFL